jgi:hypothetical protein
LVGDIILANMSYGISPPDRDADRLAEVAELLAAGLLRLRLKNARQSTDLSPDGAESSLDCLADQSVHATPQRRGIAA